MATGVFQLIKTVQQKINGKLLALTQVALFFLN